MDEGYPWIPEVPQTANEHLSSLPADAPLLHLDVLPPHYWFQGAPLRWFVRDPSRHEGRSGRFEHSSTSLGHACDSTCNVLPTG